MAREVSHTTRMELAPQAVLDALERFRDPSTWPDWNRNAASMIATNAKTLEVGDHIALHEIIKGALIESRWSVADIREGEGFCEITMKGEGQCRNERPIAKGLSDLQVTLTFLHEEGGGIEIHASCIESGMMWIFAKRLKAYLAAYSQSLLDDLTTVE